MKSNKSTNKKSFPSAFTVRNERPLVIYERDEDYVEVEGSDHENSSRGNGKEDKGEYGIEEELEQDAFYTAVYEMKWNDCRRMLKRSDALTLVQCEGFNNCGEGVLYDACLNNAPVDIVEMVCKLDPEQAGLRTPTVELTPLHNACRGAAEGVVSVLLNTAPETAEIGERKYFGHNGLLPLNIAIWEKRSPSIVKKLLTAYPEGIYHRSEDDEDILIKFMTFWQRDLERVYPDLEQLPRGNDLDGNLDGLTIMKDTFVLLLMAYAHETVDIKSILPRKWLPIHEALLINHYDVKIPPKFLRTLLRTMRLSCIQHDEDRNFPIHHMCARL